MPIVLSARARIALSAALNAPGSGSMPRELARDHRQRTLREISEIIGEVGIDAVDDCLVTVGAVLPERHFAQEKITKLIDAISIRKCEWINDIAYRF